MSFSSTTLIRLEPDILRILFRMIRLNASFPNVTYVLAFDRKVVEYHLTEKDKIQGRDYLEKIVQVNFDIPTPDSGAVHRILWHDLGKALNCISDIDLDKDRFAAIFDDGFKKYFQAIRQAKRSVNGVMVTLPLIASEVDVADFLAIELIRIFHPEVYLEVSRSTELLTSRVARQKNELSKWLEVFGNLVPLFYKDSVKGIIS